MTKSTSIFLPLVIEITQPAKAALSDFSAFAPALIALIVAVVGWTVVERYARARERRAELKALVSAFVEAVSDIHDLSIEFYQLHGSTAKARSIASALTAQIGTLSQFVIALKKCGLQLAETDAALKEFRQIITGNQFDSLTREPSLEDAAIFTLIGHAAAALDRTVQLSLFRRIALKRGWLNT